MRNHYLILLLILSLLSCTQTDNNNKLEPGVDLTDIVRSPIGENDQLDTTNVANIRLEEDSYYFGELTEGEIVSHTFYFENSGNKPLIIKDAQSTCGCTIPAYPKEIIPVNARDSVVVEFNTKNKSGYQNKVVTLIANTYPIKTRLYIKGVVKSKK